MNHEQESPDFSRGEYVNPVSDGKLSQLYEEGLKLIRGLNKATLQWIPREQNRSARSAVNRRIGEALGKESQEKTKKTQPVAFNFDLEIAEKPEELEESIVVPQPNKAPDISKDTLPSGANVKHLIEIYVGKFISLN